jgi:glycosyltransferase involved in cell wall biosynthesis
LTTKGIVDPLPFLWALALQNATLSGAVQAYGGDKKGGGDEEGMGSEGGGVRIVLVAPMRNVAATIRRTVGSLLSQKYRRWVGVFVDDASEDGGVEVGEEAAGGDGRIIFLRGDERRWSLENIRRGVAAVGGGGEDVVAILDGDDWLFNSSALGVVAAAYEGGGCWMTYGSMLYFPVGRIGAFGREIPPWVIDAHTLRAFEWVTTHLRTFRRFLFDRIRPEDLRDDDGSLLKTSGDLALMVRGRGRGRGKGRGKGGGFQGRP